MQIHVPNTLMSAGSEEDEKVSSDKVDLKGGFCGGEFPESLPGFIILAIIQGTQDSALAKY